MNVGVALREFLLEGFLVARELDGGCASGAALRGCGAAVILAAVPTRKLELHLVMDNYAAHKRVEVRNWLTANPRIKVHFTPTSGSWLNLVEVWFGIIERQAIRRGTFVSVRELISKIREFINSWNNRKHPFIWTKTPDEILAKINRKRKHTSTPRH